MSKILSIAITMILGLATLFAAGVSNASAAQSDCNALLADGVRDVEETKLSYLYYDKFKSFLRKTEASTLASAQQDANSFGVGYAGFGLQFGAASADSSFSEWKRDFINSEFSQVVQDSRYQGIKKIISETIVKGFVDCLKDAKGGTFVWIDVADEKQFLVQAQFQPPDGFVSPVTIKNFSVSNSTCSGLPRRGTKLGAIITVLCTKNSAESVAVVVLTTDPFSPKVQPKYAPIKIPAARSTFSVDGILFATAIREVDIPSQRFNLNVRPNYAEVDEAFATLRRGRNPFVWSFTRRGEFNLEPNVVMKDVVAFRQASGYYDGRACRQSNWDKRQDGEKLKVSVTNDCKLYAAPVGGSPTPDGVKDSGLNYVFEAHLQLRNVQNSQPKQIKAANALRASLDYPFDIDLDPKLFWKYVYNVTITVLNGPIYHLCRLPDGKERDADGPFRSTFSDKHVLTIIRDSVDAHPELRSASTVTCPAPTYPAPT